MTNVVKFSPSSVGPGSKLAASRILAGARKHGLTECVVFGYDRDGELYCASSEGAADTVWLLEQTKLYLLRGGVRD